jgi:hypothetical protein
MKIKLAAKTLLLTLGLVACGGAQPAPVTPIITPKPIVTAPAAPDPLFIEYAVVRTKWVTPYVRAEPSDIKAWAATQNLEPSFRHVLASVSAKDPKKGDAAMKKRAESWLARLKKGEDWDKVALESDDPSGGEFKAAYAQNFVEPVKDAFAKLKPGETSGIVKSELGYHVIRKAPPSEKLLGDDFKKASTPATTKKLAAEILARLKANPSNTREVIADATSAVLGDDAVADPDRPTFKAVERERVKDLRLSAGAKAGLSTWADGAKPGAFLESPAGDDEMFVVARAVSGER